MSIMDELKRLARPYEDDEDELDDEYDEDYLDEEEEEPEPRPSRYDTTRSTRTGSFGSTANDRASRDSNVVPINSRAQVQVVLVKPIEYRNASEVADHLLSNRTVVLNLEKTEKATARRLLDFLSGAAYAHHGKVQRVAASTYIITPANVQFQGELKDEMESNGLF